MRKWRIAGRVATGGAGLVLGSVLFTGFMFYLFCTAERVCTPDQVMWTIWGLDAWTLAMHTMLFPLVVGLAGVVAPLGYIRHAVDRVAWAVPLAVAGILSLAGCWLWTVFVIYVQFMAALAGE
jgi:hypothetical protein